MSDRSSNPDVDRLLRRAQLAIARDGAIGRREALATLGAAVALAGLGGCTRAPREEIVPYAAQPPEATPGRPRQYATAFVLGGYATGILVESHEGRPTKIEGNPDHPASLGASGVFAQASILSLYDPARLRGARVRGAAASWAEALAAITGRSWSQNDGAGLHVVLEPASSPSLGEALARLRARLPRARVWFDHGGAPPAAWEGARLAFGRGGPVLEPRWDLEKADVAVVLDGDVFTEGPQALVASRAFGRRRAPESMSRLYAVGPLVTPTTISADHVLAVRAHDVVVIAAALAHALGAADVPEGLRTAAAPHESWAQAVARDLGAHRGRSLVIAGAAQPPIVHALAHAMNDVLGNGGATVTYGASPLLEAGAPSNDLGGLRDALAAGQVDTLVVAGTNPAYTAPAVPLDRAGIVVCLATHPNETTSRAPVVLAEAHALESWGDARAFDGTVTVVQPLIEPLHEGRTALELVAALAGDPRSGHDLVRARVPDARAWRRALREGVVRGTASAPMTPAIDRASIAASLATVAPPAAGLEIVSRRDPSVHDGRFADNAWLLELPQPATTLTWTNAALVSPRTARALAVTDGDELSLTVAGRGVRAPALVAHGQADDTIGLTLGWGRRVAGELGARRGANAYTLGPGAHLGVAAAKTGGRRDLAIVQAHKGLAGRDDEIARHRSLAEHRARPPKKPRRALTLYEPPAKSGPQWGMAIDLSKCTGCSACVVACQAENNVPTVGEAGVMMGRHMHWLRVDVYVAEDGPVLQPMLCQHCEKAPCEYVCPVNATVHSPDGLNEMVYNRCVGTRFCSNNCPYKVRRFNWFDYRQHEREIEHLAHNPDVTVRERGVMEKCTFCVQRIREGEIREARGEEGAAARVKTACQEACPTGAIVFGDLRDRTSEVLRLHEDARAYAALHELGTEPRVRYLGKLRNRNPEIA